MLSKSAPVFIGLLELVVFFVFDYLYARTLNNHKRQFPELDECAPVESPDLDTVAVLDSLTTTAVQFYEHNRERFTGEPASTAHTYASVEDPASSAVPLESGGGGGVNPVHTAVVVCGTIAPIATVLLLLFHGLFGWTAFAVPVWLSYVAVIPGLAAVSLYGARTMGMSSYADITKAQWISMMWFRLDFMAIMGLVALVGVGAWLVAGCMLGVAAYLAHRVMKMEKRLSRAQRDTQLVRDEVDVSRVYAPGTAESRRAMGIQEGYSSLSK